MDLGRGYEQDRVIKVRFSGSVTLKKPFGNDDVHKHLARKLTEEGIKKFLSQFAAAGITLWENYGADAEIEPVPQDGGGGGGKQFEQALGAAVNLCSPAKP